MLFDGITDGSLSELFHIFVIFIIVPYCIYSVIIVLMGFRKIKEKNDLLLGEVDERQEVKISYLIFNI